MDSRKRNYILIGLLLILLLAIMLMLSRSKKQQPAFSTSQVKVDKQEVSASELPAGLPENVPIEPGSIIIENYKATTEGDRVQGTRTFTSRKTIAEAIKVYTDFFTKSAWNKAAEQTGEGFSTVLLKRNDSTLLIVVKEDASLKLRVVELTLTEIRNKQ